MKILKTPRDESKNAVPVVFGRPANYWIISVTLFIHKRSRMSMKWYDWYKFLAIPERKIIKHEDYKNPKI